MLVGHGRDRDTKLYLYSAFFVVGQLSFHVSAFLNVMLAVVRTISIFLPLFSPNRQLILRSVGVYTFIWSVLIVTEWVVANYVAEYFAYDRPMEEILYTYPRPGGIVISEIFYQISQRQDVSHIHFHTKLQQVLIMTLNMVLPYGLPSFICAVSAIVQVRHIFKMSARRGSTTEKSAARNQKMSVTIILLTTVFFICNTGYLLAVLLDMTVLEMNESLNYRNSFVLLLISNHLLYLNSVLTPAILICRGTSMLEFVRAARSRFAAHITTTVWTGVRGTSFVNEYHSAHQISKL